MTGAPSRVFSIPPGTPFLPTLVDALFDGTLVPGFRPGDDPLRLADATIFVPTRRAARALRGAFVRRLGGASAILPSIRALGETDEDAVVVGEAEPLLDLAPPVSPVDRMLMLAPLVSAWRTRLPQATLDLFGEPLVLPASTADSLWLARDLGALMDEVEIYGTSWAELAGMADGDLAEWWQVTLQFLRILTDYWPATLAERGRSDPAAHRSRMIDLEAERLRLRPRKGPVVAAGSTGSVPATARLIATIAGLDEGAVVLPGLDLMLDDASWDLLARTDDRPSIFGHPQFGLRRLLPVLGVGREEIASLGTPEPKLASRARLVSEALRPAETTHAWVERQEDLAGAVGNGALDEVALVEASHPREEAMAIAVAIRAELEAGDRSIALVTPDRELARRVSAELLRFGIAADDSAGTPLAATAPFGLMRLIVLTALRPGDPVAIVSLLKHPLLACGLDPDRAGAAAATVELVALRGGTGRPDVSGLRQAFEQRREHPDRDGRRPFWLPRLDEDRILDARGLLDGLDDALAPLVALRARRTSLAEALSATIAAMEAVAATAEMPVGRAYESDAGGVLARLLGDLLAASEPLEFSAEDWPDILAPLVAGAVVRSVSGTDPRVSILGTLEARLQDFDLLILGSLNEGSWPGRAESDRFMSRVMKAGIGLDPPERRIGQAAHDFTIAMGTRRIILTRSARSGDAPAVASRWLQRLAACAGKTATEAMQARGAVCLGWARALDGGRRTSAAARPSPTPPLEARPRHLSVTEVETLRRDPYAVYARRILGLRALDPLLRDPGAAERGTLFHDILHRFAREGGDPRDPDAPARLEAIGREFFDATALPPDIDAVWWPRFKAMVPEIVGWERDRAPFVAARQPELQSCRAKVGASGVTLSGRADRIDVLPGGMADIIDFKTGSTPTPKQARSMLAPQLPLEAALLARGAFEEIGKLQVSDLIYVRLKPDGTVKPETVLDARGAEPKSAGELGDEAWERLERLLAHYADPARGYLSRALPFREGDMSGDYDHLARVQEWSSGEDPEDGDT